MDAKYVFDTNVFIGLQRRQPKDIYPSVWNKLSDLMEQGIVISSREVFDELSLGDDDLAEWAKSRKECFLPSEIPIQERVRKILTEYRGLVEGGKKRNNADPFVIALAHENGCTLVSEEVRSNNEAAPKIPNVCEAYGIKQIDFVSFARELHMTF